MGELVAAHEAHDRVSGIRTVEQHFTLFLVELEVIDALRGVFEPARLPCERAGPVTPVSVSMSKLASSFSDEKPSFSIASSQAAAVGILSLWSNTEWLIDMPRIYVTLAANCPVLKLPGPEHQGSGCDFDRKVARYVGRALLPAGRTGS